VLVLVLESVFARRSQTFENSDRGKRVSVGPPYIPQIFEDEDEDEDEDDLRGAKRTSGRRGNEQRDDKVNEFRILGRCFGLPDANKYL
jgi:hypothetical protein